MTIILVEQLEMDFIDYDYDNDFTDNRFGVEKLWRGGI